MQDRWIDGKLPENHTMLTLTLLKRYLLISEENIRYVKINSTKQMQLFMLHPRVEKKHVKKK